MKHMKNTGLYLGLILSYLVVFSIPVTVNLIQLQDLTRASETAISESIRGNLTHAARSLDRTFTEFDVMVQNLSADTNMQYIALGMKESERYMRIKEWKQAQNLMKRLLVSSYLEEYYLYFFSTDTAVTTKHMFYGMDSWLQFFRYDTDNFDAEHFSKLVSENFGVRILPAKNSYMNTSPKELLLYMSSFATLTGSRGTFIFPVSAAEIRELLSDSWIGQEGWAFLHDQNGECLLTVPANDGTCTPVEGEISGEETMRSMAGNISVMTMEVTSENGFTLQAVLPVSVMTKSTRAGRIRNVLMVLLAAVGALAAALVLSLRRGRSINRVIETLDAGGGVDVHSPWDRNAMGYIADSIQTLIKNNGDLQENLREKIVLNRELLLGTMLVYPEKVTDEELEEYGIHLAGSMLLIACRFLKMAGQELDSRATVLYKQSIQSRVTEFLGMDVYSYSPAMDQAVLLCAVPEDFSSDALEKFAEKLNYAAIEFQDRYGHAVRMAVSEVCTSRDRLPIACDHVIELLSYRSEKDQPVMLSRAGAVKDSLYFFPMTLEERLVNAVVTGNEKVVHDELEEVYRVNVFERGIRPEMMHFLVNDLQCTVFRALTALGDHPEIDRSHFYNEMNEINAEPELLERFRRINGLFAALAGAVQQTPEDREDREKMEEILKYIEEHYMDSALSLNAIADHFGYSSTYFSKLFKSLFGENFTPYLEKIRIEKICEMLLQGSTVDHAAEQAGYNSTYVMRTAFKRVKGATPNDWRKLAKKEES